MSKKRIMPCLATLILSTATVLAEPTRVVVRVRSHDAKFIGSSAGGVAVTIYDDTSGAVLASGVIRGGTGDTRTLMKEPVARGQQIAGEKAASFTATVDIDRPTRVRIEVRGPLAGGLNCHTASRTLVLLPGHDIVGDGVVFELYGCIVHVVSPCANQVFKPGETVPIEAYVVMLCGCPVEPGGLWNADDFTVVATITDAKGKRLGQVPLRYSGTRSRFAGEFKPPGTGGYQVLVTVEQKGTNNAGFALSGFAVKGG